VKAGTSLYSTCCDTKIVLMSDFEDSDEILCGGHPMVEEAKAITVGEPASEWTGPTLLGKRYGDDESGLKVLCVKGGVGALSVYGRALQIAAAKTLPSSD
jgi:hypothetical protein